MPWHNQAETSSDFMRHPVDSAEWRSFKSKWPDFGSEGRNVWLGIATDGFNPRGVLSSTYSCWPVYMVPYNLPPSLCMKSEFQNICLLIPGPKAPSQDIDVFLQPLVDELKQHWEGVPAFDSYKKEKFTLKAMLLWGIRDFSALGNLSGCVTHGYKACPVCGVETESQRLTRGKKIVYTNYIRFLKDDHPYREEKDGWYKTAEHREPPTRLNGPQLLQRLDRINYIPGRAVKGSSKKRTSVDIHGNDDEDIDGSDDGELSAWYKKSTFFYMEYWITHKVRHVIDVIHAEKNFAKHLINAILDKKWSKDAVAAREDMKDLGMHSSQWMKEVQGKLVKPQSVFALNKEEKTHFYQILKDLKLPSGFSSN